MLGSALKDLLETNAASTQTEVDILALDSKTDLRNRDVTYELFETYKPNFVYHLAARVGGLGANIAGNAEFFDDNIRINSNVLVAGSETSSVSKVCSVLSTCIYPDKTSYPLIEENLFNGPPHHTNFGYAYAKRMLMVQGQALNEKLGKNMFITVIPNNMYGENDNFSLTKGHVVPTVIHKLFLAKKNGDKQVTFCGSGAPLRQFSYASDIARDMVFCMSNFNGSAINVGCYSEFSIRHLVESIKEIMGYTGEIKWDHAKPDGQFRKPSSTRMFSQAYECTTGKELSYHTLEEGLAKTIKWFESSYPNVRGV